MNKGYRPLHVRRPAHPVPARTNAPQTPAKKVEPVLPECLRVSRVARLLDVSKKRVYQLVQERRLEAIRLGPRQMRILRPSLERYIGRLIKEEEMRDY